MVSKIVIFPDKSFILSRKDAEKAFYVLRCGFNDDVLSMMPPAGWDGMKSSRALKYIMCRPLIGINFVSLQ